MTNQTSDKTPEQIAVANAQHAVKAAKAAYVSDNSNQNYRTWEQAAEAYINAVKVWCKANKRKCPPMSKAGIMRTF